MRTAGVILLVTGVVLAAIGGARTPLWAGPFWSGLGLMGLRLVLGLAERRRNNAAAVVEGAAAAASGSRGDNALAILGRIVASVEALRQEATTSALVDLGARVEALLEGDVELMIGHLDVWRRRTPADTFAGVAGPFATAERFLQRAWSAAADAHRGETRASLDACATHLGEVAAALRGRP